MPPNLRVNWCHTFHSPIADDSPADSERIERNTQSTIDTGWSHCPGECQAEKLSMEWLRLSRPFPTCDHRASAWLEKYLRYCSVGNIGVVSETESSVSFHELWKTCSFLFCLLALSHRSSTFIWPLFQLTFIYPLVLSRVLSPSIWHGRNLKMPRSPTMATIFGLSMVRSDPFSTRLHKFYGMTFTRRVVMKTSWCNLSLANCWVKSLVQSISRSVGVKLICHNKSACASTLTSNMKMLCLCCWIVTYARWRFNTYVLPLKLFEQIFPLLRMKPDGTTGTKLSLSKWSPRKVE